MAVVFRLSVLLQLLLCFTARGCSQPQQPQVPCFFIFGDSLVDNGNNNRMLTLARANYRPYGIDFPLGATGRFTNGRTYVDALAQLLGFPNYIPPYARTRGSALLRGVNFASGASGIRDETGNNLGGHTSMNQQVENFGDVVLQMRRYFRGDNATLHSYLSRCIFYAGLGSNDYLNNYFMPNFYTTSSDFTAKAYAAALLKDYTRQLTQMYNYGARKVIVSAVGPIGCIPYQLARYNGNSSRCNEKINDAVVLFNTELRKLVSSFNKGRILPEAKFVYLDSYTSSKDLYQNGASYGFEVIDKGCCGVGRNNGQITCLPLQQPCEDRTKYLFWDAFHPTEAANIMFAKTSYSSKTYTYPINIQQLASL
ncbi:GDSL esterase/lipase At1g33811 isoform X1 [Punica granatum]|uniref:GDSL esterase/lipase At1g33811 isoform X1 n=1 Tax=Punica granatum TaxID=22663 RepID=A0A6P8DDP1_PUNGR|nr:GDSL esterase/lipase At1g33811 isoform X1 [Punica granatum]